VQIERNSRCYLLLTFQALLEYAASTTVVLEDLSVPLSVPAVVEGSPVLTGAIVVPWVGLGAVEDAGVVGLGVVVGVLGEGSLGEQTQESAEAEAALVSSVLQSNFAEVPEVQLSWQAFAFSSQVVAAGGGVCSCGAFVGVLLLLPPLLEDEEEDEELPGVAQAQLEEIAPLCSSHLKSETAFSAVHVASHAALRRSHSTEAVAAREDETSKMQASTSARTEAMSFVTLGIYVNCFNII
jgi:hypothetical protein